MKIKYKLDNIIDTKRNRQDIENTVNEIARTVAELYKEYDAEVTHVKYDSSAPGKMEAMITFAIEGKGYHPLFSMTIPLSISLKPISLSQRRYIGYFTVDGVSQSFKNDLVTNYNIDTDFRISTLDGSGSASDKVKELFTKAGVALELWKSYTALSDIFLF